MKIDQNSTNSQVVQDLDEFVSSLEQIWRYVEHYNYYYLFLWSLANQWILYSEWVPSMRVQPAYNIPLSITVTSEVKKNLSEKLLVCKKQIHQ